MQQLTLAKKIKCFQYLVYGYIALLMVTGAAQILIGLLLIWGSVRYYGILQNSLWVPSIIFLSLSPMTFILSWLGCQATNQKNRCLLGMLSILLMVCVCVQLIICGWSLSMRENLPTSVELFVDDSFVAYLDKFSRTKVNNLDLWNRMQSELQCCGVDGPLDYRRLSLPWSCCSRARNAYETVCESHYKRGCLGVLSEQIKAGLLLTALSASIIAILQSFGLFFTIHLTMLLGKHSKLHSSNRLKTSRQQDLMPLSIHHKNNIMSAPLSISPSSPGQRLMKTAPTSPPELL